MLELLSYIAHHPLNRQHKIRALAGFVRWQIGARLLPWPVVYSWIGGTRVIVRRGDHGMTQNLYCGLHDFADMAYLLHVLSAEDLFVDVGANVGSYTVLACGARGAHGIAMEPVPATYRSLRDNLAINDLGERVNALNIGVAEQAGELTFLTDQGAMNRVVTGGDAGRQTVRVPVESLDAVLEGQVPAMIKIDVEGFETPVLAGARRTLSNPALHSVIMELNGSGRTYGYDEQEILKLMAGLGFETFNYEPFERRLTPLGGKNLEDKNTLFIRNRAVIEERLRQAPRFRVRSMEI